MKDKNGIEIDCENCDVNAQRDCSLWNAERGKVGSNGCREYFYPSYKAYEARIKELQDELYADKYNYESWEEIKEEHQKLEATIVKLQKELNIVQESERAEAQEADRLRGKVKELEKKLTETIKLLSESSRECGKLEAEVKILKAFVMKVHTSPVIFEDVNRALRDEAKTLLEKLNQSAESEGK